MTQLRGRTETVRTEDRPWVSPRRGLDITEWLFSAGIWTSGPLPPGGIATGFSVVSAPAILAAVSLFALAEVFAYGARLREDVDATI